MSAYEKNGYGVGDEKALATGDVTVRPAEDEEEVLQTTHIGEHGLRRDLVSLSPPSSRCIPSWSHWRCCPLADPSHLA